MITDVMSEDNQPQYFSDHFKIGKSKLKEFIRKWRFYLSYCAAGFRAKRTDVVQFELEKI